MQIEVPVRNGEGQKHKSPSRHPADPPACVADEQPRVKDLNAVPGSGWALIALHEPRVRSCRSPRQAQHSTTLPWGGQALPAAPPCLCSFGNSHQQGLSALNWNAELAARSGTGISACRNTSHSHELITLESCSEFRVQLQAPECSAVPIRVMTVSFRHTLLSSNTSNQCLKFINTLQR